MDPGVPNPLPLKLISLRGSRRGNSRPRDCRKWMGNNEKMIDVDTLIKFENILKKYFNFSIASKMFDDVNSYKENIMALYVLSKWIANRRDIL